MRYVIFWAVIGILLAARVAYYDEIRPGHVAGPEGRPHAAFDLADAAPRDGGAGGPAAVQVAGRP